MSERATEYATTFDRHSNELIALAAGLTAEQWDSICPEEGWPVGTVVHHVAMSFPTLSRWIQKISAGQQVSLPKSAIDEYNAEHAHQTYEQAATIDLLRANSAPLHELIASLTDEQLAASAPFGPADGATLSAEQVVRGAAIRHVRTHTTSLRTALGIPAT